MSDQVKLTKRQMETLMALKKLDDFVGNHPKYLQQFHSCLNVSLHIPGNDPGEYYSERLAYPHLNKIVGLGFARKINRGEVFYVITDAGRAYLASLTPASEDRPHG